MNDSSAFGFGKFIPGFDFLQNLSKAGQGTPGVPPFAHWVAPTVSVEEIDKRIEELKAVQFWLEQNNRALSATVQALQVQRMTLSTLKGMNVNMADLAKSFPFAASAASAATAAASGGASDGPLSNWPLGGAASADQPPAQPAPAASAAAPEPAAEAAPEPDAPAADAPASMATAMQWWGALTQQFQHIAQQALQDPAQQQAMLQATQMGSDFAKAAVKTAGDMVRQAVTQAVPAAATEQPAQKKPAPARKAATSADAPKAKAAPAGKQPASAKTGTAPAKKAPARKTGAR